MGWVISRSAALETALEVAMTEIRELRMERGDLLRALADARDRGDRIANALLAAKGAEPIPPSPGPPPAQLDPFEEDASIAEEIRTLMTTHGAGAVFNDHD